MNLYERESVEFQPVSVTRNGEPVTLNIELAVTQNNERPTNFQVPATLGDEIGIMVDGYAVGSYTVWAKVTDAPEVPVIVCGHFRVV